jgi:hypothetical protein
MAFKAFQPTDIVVSSDSITATLWSTNTPSLTTFFTSSTQVASTAGNYYYNVFQTASTSTAAEVQFAIAYGNADGSGSLNFNQLVDGRSPSSTIYGQYQDLVLGDENTDFVFGAITSSEFIAISFDRSRYKESLFLGSLGLTLKGQAPSSGSIVLTDNSKYVSSVVYTNGGTRVFQLISGSQGTVNTSVDPNGYSKTGSYGWFLPDIGTILLNPKALRAVPSEGGIGFLFSGSTPATSAPITPPLQDIYTAISGGASFLINSQETITSDFIFIRPQSSEFNYSENPSFISGSTGEVIYSDFINNPQTYITTVGLYNDNNELLAVAKLSRPLSKNFTSEALIRVKLDF